ncbi:MAG TPA: molecular chaperone DnaJ [Blastocatellia bacterium]|nr:molecular chaperone DnaJ [Blastocatellia bacterium]
MLQAAFRPITRWPRKPTDSWRRQRSRFRAGYRDTLDLLERELNHLKAKDIIIELFLTSKEIRNDGWPRSDARPTQPGVVLRFRGKHGDVEMPCDTFTAWEDNLRAIGLSLRALRDVDRYGVTTGGEQYRGWTALPESTGGDPLLKAAGLIVANAGAGFTTSGVLASSETLDSAFRAAIRNVHPDNPNGNAEVAQQVIAARDRIKAAKGWQ